MGKMEGFPRCCSALFSLERSHSSGKEAWGRGLAKTQRKEDMLDHITPPAQTHTVQERHDTVVL